MPEIELMFLHHVVPEIEVMQEYCLLCAAETRGKMKWS